jgi:hypothetical protein
MQYVVKTTFLTPHRDGQWHPAYARFVGDGGNNFLSNPWRADSEANTSDAVVALGVGCVGTRDQRCVRRVLARFTPEGITQTLAAFPIGTRSLFFAPPAYAAVSSK